MNSISVSSPGRNISSAAIVLLAVAVHGPLLLMQLPARSYDAWTHMFFADHYAHHWFNPWNEKWFAGFSQTTYPPLAHQLIALFSFVMSLQLAYMVVQLLTIMLLVGGVYRYAKIWVDERSASYAAIGSIFLGSLALLTYQAGQINTLLGTALTVNAVPYFYRWMRDGGGSRLLKGVSIFAAAAAVHHITLIAIALFSFPAIWLALVDRDESDASSAGVLARCIAFVIVTGVLVAVVLTPFWMAFIKNPVRQLPIPHPSRDNYLLNLNTGLAFWLVPYGALALAVPYIFLRGGGNRRLRPLFFGWWITTLIGLGGTTPVAKLIFGRLYYVLTFERFTFMATVMALPIAALLANAIITRWRAVGAAALWVAAVLTFSTGVAWTYYHPIGEVFKTDQVAAFLNRDDHSKFRYMTLGFGSQFSELSTKANANSIDGDYNSARLLPEMTQYGSGKLDSSKYWGTSGMESLKAMLRHANQYGLRYIFVRDRYYEPLLAFTGWRPVETYENGSIKLWTKDDVPPAQRMDFGIQVPPAWQGVMWGVLPLGIGGFALLTVLLLPERRRLPQPVEIPGAAASVNEPVFLREAR